jgi:hypothetical protein
MSESKAPTSLSTTPLGNTRDVTPTPLVRDISPFVRKRLQDFPDANKRVSEYLAKKKTQSGLARR